MKLVVVPSNKDDIGMYIEKGADALILGLEKFSINYLELSIEDIKHIVNKYPNTEIFISINKTIFNSELKELEKKMLELDNISIKGILFYDLAVLYLRNKNHLKVDLVWNQTHMVTNYNTCNYYFNKGVEYGFLSSEITIDEMMEIKRHTKMQLFTFLIGHSIMSHSKRKLLTNYYTSIHKDYDGQDKIIWENDKNYIVREKEYGTCILNGDVTNGTSFINDLIKVGIEYGVIHTYGLSQALLEQLIPLVKDVMISGSKARCEDIQKLIGNNTTFFDKKTIFKVKKDEKKD